MVWDCSNLLLLYYIWLLKIDFRFSNLTVDDFGFNNENVVFTGADGLISQVVWNNCDSFCYQPMPQHVIH